VPHGACNRSGGALMNLLHHGDADAVPGAVDLAVNVRADTPPEWLRAVISGSLADIAAYPNQDEARAAVARRHGRSPDEVLLTSGAAEAFVLLARVLRPRRAVVVHPQFTEPEAALVAAGHIVERVVLEWPFTLDPAVIPHDADLVMIGNPTNPTSRSHARADLLALARPGRTLVVDEAFADFVPGEPDSLAGLADVPGLIVLRSLTKMWGLAGLRCGYLLGDAVQIADLASAQPLWPLSTPALAASLAVSAPHAVAEAEAAAVVLVGHRTALLDALATVPDVRVVPDPAGPFVLLRLAELGDPTDGEKIRLALLDAGYAVRRGDTFPGLDASWLRVAVRDPGTSRAFADTLAAVLAAAQ
jgi:histidinol-phosphate aminotransferase